jgi:hypothetical protein
LWHDGAFRPEAGTTYTLVGNVHTDRVVGQVLRDANVLTGSPTVYVSQTNNERTGCIGLLSEGGTAVFSGWAFKPGE